MMKLYRKMRGKVGMRDVHDELKNVINEKIEVFLQSLPEKIKKINRYKTKII